MKNETKAYYIVEIHDYLSSSPCETPAECEDTNHWYDHSEEFETAAEAEEEAEIGTDGPASRVTKVESVVIVKVERNRIKQWGHDNYQE